MFNPRPVTSSQTACRGENDNGDNDLYYLIINDEINEQICQMCSYINIKCSNIKVVK